MYLLPEKEKAISDGEDSDSDDHDDNWTYGNFSPYELAAMKKREENLWRIKEMGIHKNPLVCSYRIICIHSYHSKHYFIACIE